MAVFVDDAMIPFGRMVMCHLWADTRPELFAMVDKIGVQRKWFQRPADVPLPGMKASWEHFDISAGKRLLAIRYGAVKTDKFGPLEWLAMRDIMSGDDELAMWGDERLDLIENSRRLRDAKQGSVERG